MKQLFSVLCISGLLTLAGCSSEKKDEVMPNEPVSTQMSDDNGGSTEMEGLEEPGEFESK